MKPGREINANTMKNKAFLSFIAIAMLLNVAMGQNPDLPESKPVKDFQLSLIPFIGSDGANAINNTYRLSVNILAGITGGIEGVEAGGFLNITRGNVRGVQVSGFGNLVSGDLRGIQAAGFINVAGGDVQALRGSGFLNITGGSFKGFTGAGFANVTGGNHQGFAGAGFANVTGGNFMGFQGAGFGNFTGGDVYGPQLAGFMNTAGNVRGIQAAGFLNIAREVEGIQLGFINIADTISGLPIGFLSIVKRGGLRQFEISGSDALHVGAAFRIGLPAFYNIFSAGYRPFDSGRTGGFGYGIGTAIALSEALVMNIEAHSTQLRTDWSWKIRETDMLNEGRLLLGVNAGNRIQLFAGAVLYNHYYRDCPDCHHSTADIAPSRVFYERNHRNYTSKYWFGARAGLRMGI